MLEKQLQTAIRQAPMPAILIADLAKEWQGRNRRDVQSREVQLHGKGKVCITHLSRDHTRVPGEEPLAKTFAELVKTPLVCQRVSQERGTLMKPLASQNANPPKMQMWDSGGLERHNESHG